MTLGEYTREPVSSSTRSDSLGASEADSPMNSKPSSQTGTTITTTGRERELLFQILTSVVHPVPAVLGGGYKRPWYAHIKKRTLSGSAPSQVGTPSGGYPDKPSSSSTQSDLNSGEASSTSMVDRELASQIGPMPGDDTAPPTHTLDE